MTDNYKAQQKAFLNVVNRFGGLPPTFKFDSAHGKIVLVEAPPLFIELLVEGGFSLSLTRDGISVYHFSLQR